MDFVEWKPEFDIGETRIDIQHRHLVSLINMLHAGVNADMDLTVVGHILDELSMYIAIHFNYEEKWMEAVGFPELDKHRALHKDLRDELEKFQVEYDHDPNQPCGELCDFLQKWLMEHVMEEDAKFKPYV